MAQYFENLLAEAKRALSEEVGSALEEGAVGYREVANRSQEGSSMNDSGHEDSGG